MWHVASHCHFVFSFVANFKKSTFTSVFCVCSSGSSSSSWRNHVAAATPTLPGVRVCVCEERTHFICKHISLTHTLTERGKESNTNSRFELPLCRSPRGQKISFFFTLFSAGLSHDLNSWLCRQPGMKSVFKINAKQNWAIEKLNRNRKMFTVTLKWH